MRRRGRAQGRAEGVRASALGLDAHSRRTQRHGREAGARVGHGGGMAGAWATRQQNFEHLAGAGAGEVGAGFGPPMGRIGKRALNKV